MIYRQLDQHEFDALQGRILYEDNHLIVVNKLCGEIAQGDKTGDECLAETYKAFIAQRDGKPGRVFMGIPHRLDRPVSGAILLAKTSKALERLSQMLRKGNIHKTYWALCCQAPHSREGELQDWMVRNERLNKSFICKEGTQGAKVARLRYRHIADTQRYHLLEIDLLTGRHHQIRCQLSAMGCPIKGDLKYGAPRSNPDGGINLHSRRLLLEHPVSHIQLDITAPLPPSWPDGLQEIKV